MRALALCLFLVGCSSAPEIPPATGTSHQLIPITIDSSMADFAGDFYAGAAGWNVIGAGYFIENDRAAYNLWCATDSIAPFIAFTSKAGIAVDCSVFATYSQEQRERTLMHEVGHLMGLDHTLEPESVMYAQRSDGGPIATQYDIAEYERIHNKGEVK